MRGGWAAGLVFPTLLWTRLSPTVRWKLPSHSGGSISGAPGVPGRDPFGGLPGMDLGVPTKGRLGRLEARIAPGVASPGSEFQLNGASVALLSGMKFPFSEL